MVNPSFDFKKPFEARFFQTTLIIQPRILEDCLLRQGDSPAKQNRCWLKENASLLILAADEGAAACLGSRDAADEMRVFRFDIKGQHLVKP